MWRDAVLTVDSGSGMYRAGLAGKLLAQWSSCCRLAHYACIMAGMDQKDSYVGARMVSW